MTNCSSSRHGNSRPSALLCPSLTGRDVEPLTPNSFFTSRNTDPRCVCGSRIPTATTAACSRRPAGRTIFLIASSEWNLPPGGDDDDDDDINNNKKKNEERAIDNYCDLLTLSRGEMIREEVSDGMNESRSGGSTS